jgi:hypothetical protein
MNISTHITRLAKTIALGLALAALAVPAAQAGDILVDDWFRDANQTSAQVGDILVDDWFRDANRASAQAKTTCRRTSAAMTDTATLRRSHP